MYTGYDYIYIYVLRELCIDSKSRTTIQAHSSLTVRLKLVKECMASLEIASSYFHSRLVRMPGHSGSLETYKLARKGTLTKIPSHGTSQGSPVLSRSGSTYEPHTCLTSICQ